MSQHSTGLSRDERRDAGARGGKPSLTVLSYNEAAFRAGIVRRTLERLLAEGTGPAKVQISKRRVGILEADLERWLTSRRRPAPGQDAA